MERYLLKPYLALLLLCSGIFCALQTHAEVITDGSTGVQATLQGPDFAITQELGDRRGNNLFHSFQTFNINTGESATFTGSSDIANIISRVTGGELSTIDGALNSEIPNANFFLINPAGLLFGPNSSINVDGAVYLSTADSLNFADGQQFQTNQPETSGLTSAPPQAFGFLDNPGNVTFDTATIQSETPSQDPNGRPLAEFTINDNFSSFTSLHISGGDILIDFTTIDMPFSVIDIATTQTATTIPLLNPNALSTATGSSVTLLNQSELITQSGVITIHTGDFSISRGQINVNNFSDENSGRIEISTAESATFDNNAAIRAHAGSAGNSLGILIDIGTDFLITDEAFINSASLFTATGGSAGVVINANHDVSITDQGFVGATTDGDGNAGDVAINAGHDVIITTDGRVNTTTNGSGNAGNVTVAANNQIFIDDTLMEEGITDLGTANPRTSIRTDDELFGFGHAGDSGDITLIAQDIFLGNNIQVNAGGIGEPGDDTPGGRGGDLLIQADTLTLQGVSSTITNFVFEFNTVIPGNTIINVEQLNILNEGRLSLAGGGNNIINSSDIFINNGLIEVDTGTTLLDGDSRTLTINTNNLSIEESGRIVAIAFEEGDTSDININASDSVQLSAVFDEEDNSRSDITAASIENTSGRFGGQSGDININTPLLLLNGSASIEARASDTSFAGDININVNALHITNGAFIRGSAGNLNQNTAGSININATTSILLQSNGSFLDQILFEDEGLQDLQLNLSGIYGNTGFLGVASDGSNAASNINISSPSITLDGGIVSTLIGNNPFGTLFNGNIVINSNEVNLLNGSVIVSSTQADNIPGGNIDINTSSLSISGFDRNNSPSQILSQSFSDANSGEISITANSIDLESSLINVDTASTFTENTAGSISIETNSINLTNGAQIGASSISGQGGTINILASESISFTGVLPEELSGSTIFPSGLFSIAENGDAGAINLNSPSITINSGLVTTRLDNGSGSAGNINIHASQLTLTNTGNITSLTTDNANGPAGSININSASTSISNSSINVANFGIGDAGNINISSPRELRILEDTSIASSSITGEGGNINILIQDLFILRDGEITTSVLSGVGNGGNIFIDPTIVFFDQGSIIAQAVEGNGGNIDIISDFLFDTGTTTISASSQLGIDGQVDIQAPEFDILGDLSELSSAFKEQDINLGNSCARSKVEERSSFAVLPVNGLSISPEALFAQ